MKSSFVFSALVTPLMIIGIFIILIINLGWVGIVSPLVVMILIPIQFLIGRKNGSLYGEVNVEKDKRIKLSTDIIENIKSIKFYGWERAFKKLI